MAYNGSTAASSIANPPVLMFGTNASVDQRIPGSGTTGSTIYMNNAYKASTSVYSEGRAFGGQLWGYWSTDNTTAIASSGYFTDAGPLGMRPGDMILAVGSTGGAGTVVTRLLTISNISTSGAAAMSSAGGGGWSPTT